MDKGELVKNPIEVIPVMAGGYIVRGAVGPYQHGMMMESRAFTNYRDLLAFLNEDYEEANRSYAAQPPTEGSEG